jgi:hypothetical protein
LGGQAAPNTRLQLTPNQLRDFSDERAAQLKLAVGREQPSRFVG